MRYWSDLCWAIGVLVLVAVLSLFMMGEGTSILSRGSAFAGVPVAASTTSNAPPIEVVAVPVAQERPPQAMLPGAPYPPANHFVPTASYAPPSSHAPDSAYAPPPPYRQPPHQAFVHAVPYSGPPQGWNQAGNSHSRRTASSDGTCDLHTLLKADLIVVGPSGLSRTLSSEAQAYQNLVYNGDVLAVQQAVRQLWWSKRPVQRVYAALIAQRHPHLQAAAVLMWGDLVDLGAQVDFNHGGCVTETISVRELVREVQFTQVH